MTNTEGNATYRQGRLMMTAFVTFTCTVGILTCWLVWIVISENSQSRALVENQKTITLNGNRISILEDELEIHRIQESENKLRMGVLHAENRKLAACRLCHTEQFDTGVLVDQIHELAAKETDLRATMNKRLQAVRDLEIKK